MPIFGEDLFIGGYIQSHKKTFSIHQIFLYDYFWEDLL
jgi:hypothetical protein